jgi:Arc/MetJ-type ribon-helix-helix transcriptional regulator
MVRTQIQLTREQFEAVKRTAASRNISSAEVIRQAVEVMLKSRSVSDEGHRRSRALKAAGAFRSGSHDVSKNHDVYLAEAYDE